MVEPERYMFVYTPLQNKPQNNFFVFLFEDQQHCFYFRSIVYIQEQDTIEVHIINN